MEYTIEQLKAAGYDTLAGIERLQTQLRQINIAIANKSDPKTVKPEVVEEEKVVEEKTTE